MAKRPPHPFVMLARRMSRQETREYLTALGWERSALIRDDWTAPEGVEVMRGTRDHLPPGVSTSYTTRAALLTAFRRAEDAVRSAEERATEEDRSR
jgi:hypothetical protein